MCHRFILCIYVNCYKRPGATKPKMDILSVVLTFIAFSLLFVILTLSVLLIRTFTGKSVTNQNYPPVHGTIFHQLLYFNKLYDHQTESAKKQRTFRLLTPGQSEIYTTDIRNIEHILKTNFDKYSKGERNQDISTDLFGQGIFIVDGEKWRQQRKLASFEFSTRVLRDFSCSVFKRNAAKLVRAVSKLSDAGLAFDMQVSDLKSMQYCRRRMNKGCPKQPFD